MVPVMAPKLMAVIDADSKERCLNINCISQHVSLKDFAHTKMVSHITAIPWFDIFSLDSEYSLGSVSGTKEKDIGWDCPMFSMGRKSLISCTRGARSRDRFDILKSNIQIYHNPRDWGNKLFWHIHRNFNDWYESLDKFYPKIIAFWTIKAHKCVSC